jgi:iron complex transport system permease protein
VNELAPAHAAGFGSLLRSRLGARWWKLRLRAAGAEGRPFVWIAAGALFLLALAVLAATRGAVELAALDVARAILEPDHPLRRVVWDVRLPRVLVGAIVGADLALAGVLLQTVVQNRLADPGILGVTAGAGVAGLVAILIFPEAGAWVPWAAFLGGLAAVLTLLLLAHSPNRRTGPLRIVLSGVALQSALFAGIALLTFAFADRAPSFAAFMAGSLNGLGWRDASLVVLPSGVALAGVVLGMRSLNVLLLDDSTAGGVGLPVRRVRIGAACVAALFTAAAVSVAGLVGFVGLVVPNAMRLVVGPDHRVLVPASALAGAALVVGADTVARTLIAPLELPVGALLALIGAPYFLYLLWKKLP